MCLQLKQLDRRTRLLMLEEIEDAESKGSLYISEQLNTNGKVNYSTLLKHAVKNGNDETFALALVARESFRSHETKWVNDEPKWVEINSHVAANNLAENEFNRYYIRAICKRALQDGILTVTMYDAHEIRNNEDDFDTGLNKAIDAESLWRELKNGAPLISGLKTSLGLSVKIEYRIH